ncbi:MAG: penicillin-binding protein 1A, partial [Merismopediaceae bacterium]|nr:penicillin-binding protein 1A [Merismopediaceae bacterium]
MLQQFTRQLKHKTSRVLYRLAEVIDRPEAETPAPSSLAPADPPVAPGLPITLDPTEATHPVMASTSPEETAMPPDYALASPVTLQSLGRTGETYTSSSESGRSQVLISVKSETNGPTTLLLSPDNSPEIPTTQASPDAPETIIPPVSRPRKRRRPRRSVSIAPAAFLTQWQTTLAPVGQGLQRFRQHPRFWLLLGFGIGAGSGAIALGWGVYTLESLTRENIAAVATYARPGTLTIQASNGTVLQQIGPVSHDQLKLGAIPVNVRNAFIASEDRRFNEHRGVDLQGILRAAVSNVQAGDVRQGGSTITQQLARLVFLDQDRNFGRKVREMWLAQKIEQKVPKEQILERYLNLVYLGSGAYGVADAAWAYFSKKPEQLTIGEAATLAGVVPAPSLYSPLENKEKATTRRNEVLQAMQEAGFITEAQKQQAIAAPLVLKPSPLKRFERQAPFFTDYVMQELPQLVPPEQLKQGGITVSTTLNYPWQASAQSTLTKMVSEYGPGQRFSEGALVSLDSRTGAIMALVGGKDYQKNQFNRVTQAKRQPGSTFKPILYAAAIASGISPNKTYLNAPFTIRGYTPENYGDTYSGGQMSLRQALTNSVNVVAVKLLLDVGWTPVINLARKMGITSPLEPTYSLALGAWEMTPLEMTSAYTTFANNGVHVQSYAIAEVKNAEGKVLYQNKLKSQKAIDPDSNAIMISLMKSVVTSGTGRPAQLSDRQVAGKTGTSDQARDLWFIGYIPQLTTGVWLGNDNNQPTRGASATAAKIWGDYMQVATKGMPVEYFPAMPKDLSKRQPSIKAEPLKGHRVVALALPATVGDSVTSEPRSRRRSRRQETLNQDETSRTTSRRRRRRTYSADNTDRTTET